jgi:hypothetical protein
MATNSGCEARPPAFRSSRGGEADEGQAQHLPAQALEVDLQAGEEQQVGQAHRREDLDGVVDVDPAERGGADEDPDHDLQHDRRQPHRGEEAERQRGGEARGDDDQQVRERELHGAAQSPAATRPLRVGGGAPRSGREG